MKETKDLCLRISKNLKAKQILPCVWICAFDKGCDLPVQEREMEMRRQALEEERRRREELEKRLQEETSRRQRLVEREVKLREKQRSQVFPRTRFSDHLWPECEYYKAGHNVYTWCFVSFLFFYSPGC